MVKIKKFLKNIKFILYFLVITLIPILLRDILKILLNISLPEWIGYAGSIIGALIGGFFIIRVNQDEREKNEKQKEKENKEKKRNRVNIAIYRKQPFLPSIDSELGKYDYIYLTSNYKERFYKFYKPYIYATEQVNSEKISTYKNILAKNKYYKYLSETNNFEFLFSKFEVIDNLKKEKAFFIKDFLGNVYFININENNVKDTGENIICNPIDVDFMVIKNSGGSDFLKNVEIFINAKNYFSDKYEEYNEKVEMFTWNRGETILIPLIGNHNGEILVEKVFVEYTTQADERNKIILKNSKNDFSHTFKVANESTILQELKDIDIKNQLISIDVVNKFNNFFDKVN